MSLDLHGYTIHNAWKVFNEHVEQCYYKGQKENSSNYRAWANW